MGQGRHRRVSGAFAAVELIRRFAPVAGRYGIDVPPGIGRIPVAEAVIHHIHHELITLGAGHPPQYYADQMLAVLMGGADQIETGAAGKACLHSFRAGIAGGKLVDSAQLPTFIKKTVAGKIRIVFREMA